MTGAPLRALAAGLALVSVSGCCWLQSTRDEPETLVVVVPSRHDGHVGTVVVNEGQEQRQVLNTAYAAARIHGAAAPERSTMTAEDVKRVFAAASDALPRPAITYTLFFKVATDDLTPESNAKLDEILGEVAGREAAEIVVIGHTDRMGTDQRNDLLSLRRAQHVAELVVKRGAKQEIVHAIGLGEREPVVATPDGVAEAQNRRVEIVVR
jgi:OOP family OmpA-OmpF porin